MNRSDLQKLPRSSASSTGAVTQALAATVAVLCVCGCTQMAVVGKWLVGDPKVEAAFAQMTGKSLEDGATVALVVTAPDTVLVRYDAVAFDIEEVLERLMSRHGIHVVDSDEVTDVLNAHGGRFDAQVLAQEIEADYVLHIDLEYFDHRVPNSSQLVHGIAGGNVYGYEVVHGDDPQLGLRTLRVFERQFRTEYPGQHPVPIDRTPERVFRNRFVDAVCADLGRMFYDFRTQEAF